MKRGSQPASRFPVRAKAVGLILLGLPCLLLGMEMVVAAATQHSSPSSHSMLWQATLGAWNLWIVAIPVTVAGVVLPLAGLRQWRGAGKSAPDQTRSRRPRVPSQDRGLDDAPTERR